MQGLELYEKVRSVPETAQRIITGGRLNGKTDINPMWRIKTLTENFGMCGIGWRYVVTNKWLEKADNSEVAAFVDIQMFVKIDKEWSSAIEGTGGSMFVASEKNGLKISDECFKMALTDAISVACKALGIGADVYWNKDSTKYGDPPFAADTVPHKAKTAESIVKTSIIDEQGYSPEYNQARIAKIANDRNLTSADVMKVIMQVTNLPKRAKELTEEEYIAVVIQIEKLDGKSC